LNTPTEDQTLHSAALGFWTAAILFLMVFIILFTLPRTSQGDAPILSLQLEA
jgi:hypothetical protein